VKILNLYAGIGGNRKLWGDEAEITAVEFNQEIADTYKSFYPKDNVIVDDALKYLTEHWREFDFIWASPPCQTHSKMRYLASKRGSYEVKMPDMSLYSLIIFLKHFCKEKKWVVENVVPYYEPLIQPTQKLDRHLFWSNFEISFKEFEKPEIKHNKVTGTTDRYGINLKGIKLEHRKDQIIRNCVNPEVGLHILFCAFNSEQKQQKLMEVKSGCDANDDGIPPNDKSLGILPHAL
jgi:DNA (cytosine-5)-methyltransferase 1